MTGTKWMTWLTVVAGAALLCAPFAFGYYTASDLAMYEAVVVGLLIGGLGLWAALDTSAPAGVDYAVGLLGAWSIVAPFVLGYHTTVVAARNSDVVIGLAVVLMALLGHYYHAASMTRRKATA